MKPLVSTEATSTSGVESQEISNGKFAAMGATLPTRMKANSLKKPHDAQFLSDRALTGKQEHCEWTAPERNIRETN